MTDQRGTNRDYDDSQTSKNQGHGHPREEREHGDDAGVSDRADPERVRGDDKVGGKVRRIEHDQD